MTKNSNDLNEKHKEQKMTRKDVLDMAAKCVLGNREQDHGKPEDSFGMVAKLWSDYLGIEVTPTDVTALMILLKLTRIKKGGGSGDNFVDIAGYAACAGEIANVECREIR